MHAGVGATNSCHAKKEAGSIEPASFYFCASDTAARRRPEARALRSAPRRGVAGRSHRKSRDIM
jgi:hypothetical protein